MGELTWFLGVRILRDRLSRKIWLCQDSYIEKIATTFNLNQRKPPATPMPVEQLTPNENQVTPQQIHAYQWKVGSINYAATITRPDIARAASNLSEFMQNPSPRHQEVVDQVIAYLNGTR